MGLRARNGWETDGEEGGGRGAQVKQVKREKNTHNDGQEKNSLAVDKY